MGTRNPYHFRAYFKTEEQYRAFDKVRLEQQACIDKGKGEFKLLAGSVTCQTLKGIIKPVYEKHVNPDGLICVSVKGCCKGADLSDIAEELSVYTKTFSILCLEQDAEVPLAVHAGIDYDHLSIDGFFGYNYDDNGLQTDITIKGQEEFETDTFELTLIDSGDIVHFMDMNMFPDGGYELQHDHTYISVPFLKGDNK